MATATDIANNKARMGTESFFMSDKNVGGVRALKYIGSLDGQS